MARVIWKGAISFGLVNVPVALYPASQESGIDFDWLDRKTMDPVGYKRVNKRTGREIANDDIVKGIKQEGGDYVVLGDDEIKAAYPKTTQTIEIEAFVKASEISFVHLEKPYFTAPSGKGSDKVYALLREAMKAAGVIGVARVVMHNKEHLAALIPDGDALVLDTIRWAAELRPRDEIPLPSSGKGGPSLKEAELKMARQLIADMTTAWKPDAYEDRFTEAIHALARKRVAAGKTEKVEPLEGGLEPAKKGNVVDLTELLKQSLAGRQKGGKADARADPKAGADGRAKTASTSGAKADARPAARKPARRKAA